MIEISPAAREAAEKLLALVGKEFLNNEDYKKVRAEIVQLAINAAHAQGMMDAAEVATKQQNFELDQTDRVITHNGTCNQVKRAILNAIKQKDNP